MRGIRLGIGFGLRGALADTTLRREGAGAQRSGTRSPQSHPAEPNIGTHDHETFMSTIAHGQLGRFARFWVLPLFAHLAFSPAASAPYDYAVPPCRVTHLRPTDREDLIALAATHD